MAGSQPQSGVSTLTLHSSWRGIITALASGVALSVAGLFGVSRVGFETFPTIILIAGLGLALIALLDFPIATRFDRTGFRRRMVLRSPFTPWENVRQLTRTRPGMFRADKALVPGGLTAVVGKRRVLLVDQAESMGEFDDLVTLTEDAGFGEVSELISRPGQKVAPTWLYRRKHWHPESVSRR